MSPDRTYSIGKHLLAWAFVGGVIVLFVWYAFEFLLLVFAGLLFAILLVACTEWCQKRIGLSRNWAFAGVVLTLTLAVSLLLWLFANRAIEEGSQMLELLPKAIHQAKEWMLQTQWGSHAMDVLHRGSQTLRLEQTMGTLVSGLFGAAAGLIVVLAVGFFFALDPESYKHGMLRLVPSEHRPEARTIMDDVEYTLRWWLIGQLIPMVVLGTATYIALTTIGVPLALALSLLTAILIFVPYVGALLSEIPAVLVALTQSPSKALEVFLLYVGVHIVEAYALTPMVQRRAVRLPPVVAILAQAFMWTMAGVMGMALAAPLAATILTLIRSVYLKEAPADS